MQTLFTTNLLLFLCLTIITGCGQKLTLKTTTTPGDVQPGAPVTINGEAAGYCLSVGPNGEVEFVVTNRILAQTLRGGTVHVRERGRVPLVTSAAEPAAAALRDGDVIPTESKATHFGRQWSRSALLLIGLAAVVMGICLIKLLLLKMAGPFIPVLIALLLAAFTAWVVSPLLTPLIEKSYSKLVLHADSTAAGQSPNAGTSALARWQSRVVASLGTRPDPRLIAFVLVSALSVPPWLWLICRLRSMSRGACAALGASALIASVVPAAAGTTGVSFTRDYLGAEQRKARDLVAAAEQAWGTAYRFIEAGLVREAAEELVRINFNLDRAEVILHGHVDRVANLKSSAFRYIVSEQRQKLTAEFNVILQRLQACQKEASILHQRATATIGTDAVVLQMYLVQQARYRRRIQEGLIDSNPVVNELRELVPFGLANVRAGLVTSETASQCKIRDDGSIALPTGQIVLPDGRPKVEKNLTEDTTAADLAYLKRQAQGLQQQVAQLRRIEEEAKRRPLPPAVVTNVVILTDEVRTVIERQVPAPAPPPATNRIIEYVTNVQKVMVNRPVTNTIVVEKPMPRATSPAPVIGTAIVEKPVPGPIASRDTNTSVGLPDTPPSTGAFRLIAAEPARTAGAHTNPSPAGRLDHSQWTRGDPVVRSVSQARTPLVVAKTGSTPALRGFGTPLLALASTSAAALVGLVLIGIIRWSHRRFDVVIAKIGSDGAATPTVLTVQSKAERIVLGEGHPHVEPADLQHPVPAAITVDRFGRPAITASLGRVHLRDQIVENRTTRLQVGDQVEVHRADHKTAPEIYALREVTCAASDDAKLQHAA